MRQFVVAALYTGVLLAANGLAAQDLAAARQHDGRRVALQRLAEGIVCRQEEPALAAALDRGRYGRVRQRPGIEGPLHGGGRAFRPGQVG